MSERIDSELFLCNKMPRSYIRQTQIETLSIKTGLSSYRLSEQKHDLFGTQPSDELTYFRGQNTDTQAVNRYRSDALTKFGNANGADGSSRADQIERAFHEAGTYP